MLTDQNSNFQKYVNCRKTLNGRNTCKMNKQLIRKIIFTKYLLVSKHPFSRKTWVKRPESKDLKSLEIPSGRKTWKRNKTPSLSRESLVERLVERYVFRVDKQTRYFKNCLMWLTGMTLVPQRCLMWSEDFRSKSMGSMQIINNSVKSTIKYSNKMMITILLSLSSNYSACRVTTS